MAGWRPLSGIRVLDLTRNVAGPFATTILADLGAAVTKVEQPGSGDDTRQWGPPFVDDDGAMFLQLNRNKESIALDLAHPAAREVMTRLIREADVVVESFRAGSLEKLGYGPDWAQRENPRLIYASITAYGDTGPRKDLPGYDPLMQAYSGLMSVTGAQDAPPVRVGFSVVDMGTGMWCAIAVLASLSRVRQTGKGERIVTALYETSIAWSMMILGTLWANGEKPQAYGSGIGTIVPYRAYRAHDAYVFIAAGNDRLFARLAQVLGHDEWVSKEGFRTNAQRVSNRETVDAAVAQAVAGRKASELLENLESAGIPAVPIRDLNALIKDPQAEALGIFAQAGAGPYMDQPIVSLPVKGDGQRCPILMSAPTLGQHNESVLARLGFDMDAIAAITPAMSGN